MPACAPRRARSQSRRAAPCRRSFAAGTKSRTWQTQPQSRFGDCRDMSTLRKFDFTNTALWIVTHHKSRAAEQQAGIAVGIEPVAGVDRMCVGALHDLEASEGRDQHEQGRA